MKKILMTVMTIYSLCINNAFATNSPQTKHNSNTRFLIKSFVKDYSQRIERDIAQYNKLRKNPKDFLKVIPKEEYKPFLNLLDKHNIQQLPEIKSKGNSYQARVGNYNLEFNLVSLFQNSVTLNGKSFTYKTNDHREFDRIIKRFSNNKKSTFFNQFFIDEANAAFILPILAAIGITMIVVGFYQRKEKRELETANQMRKMNKEIKRLVIQCEEDLPLVGKPEKVKETLALLSLFANYNQLQSDKLENHLYKTLSDDKKEFDGITYKDPTSCEAFTAYVKKSYQKIELKMKEMEGHKIESEICLSHNLLKNCLEQFDQNFKTSGENRTIESYIQNYTPENNFLKRSIQK